VCALSIALGMGCGKADPKAPPAKDLDGKPIKAGDTGADRSYDVAVSAFDLWPTLAPNATYAQNNLGANAGEGKTFACVHYSIAGRGGEPAFLPQPVYIGSDGKDVNVDPNGTSKAPSDWIDELKLEKVPAGKTLKGFNCYVLSVDVAKGSGKLAFRWGDKQEKLVELPAATAGVDAPAPAPATGTPAAPAAPAPAAGKGA
jgi:hypothetical protein